LQCLFTRACHCKRAQRAW